MKSPQYQLLLVPPEGTSYEKPAWYQNTYFVPDQKEWSENRSSRFKTRISLKLKFVVRFSLRLTKNQKSKGCLNPDITNQVDCF